MSSPRGAVWGRSLQAAATPVATSLRTLMQEEADARTARQLSGVAAVVSPERPSAATSGDDEDAQLRLALELSAQQFAHEQRQQQHNQHQPHDDTQVSGKQAAAGTAAESTPTADATDDAAKGKIEQQRLLQLQHDFALALSLQENEVGGRSPTSSQQRRRPSNPNEKVSTVPAWLAVDPAELLLFGEGSGPAAAEWEEDWHSGDDEDDDDDDDEEEDWFESEVDVDDGWPDDDDDFDLAPGRSSSSSEHQQQQQQQQPTAGAAAPTKHDPIVCGLRNAARIERTMESGDLAGVVLSNRVASRLEQRHRRAAAQQTRVRGNRADTHTSEAVLDAETRLSLLKMLNSATLASISGAISTGKEANVYHAVAGPGIVSEDINDGTEVAGTEVAVKVYKTRLNEFRNRSTYIEGEFRFRHKRAGWRNPKKLIRLWAEKELRNLKRLRAGGVACPQPVLLKGCILLMHFLGRDGLPSPTLKEATLSDHQLSQAYPACAKLLRQLYHTCRLIHADLSEYNLLWHDKQLFVIDCAQSVDREHPRAMEFLKRDCASLTMFFRRRHVPTLTVQQLFEFVVDVSIVDADARLAALQTAAVHRADDHDERVQEAIFMTSTTPRKLSSQPYLTPLQLQQSSGHVVSGMSPS